MTLIWLKMKTPLRHDFEGFERVSSFPYMWLRSLAHWVVIAACGSAVYFFVPFADSSMRNAASMGALFLACIIVLIFQHLFASFSCQRCRSRMEKYRDPNTSKVIFYYTCDKCRIFWKNVGLGQSGKIESKNPNKSCRTNRP